MLINRLPYHTANINDVMVRQHSCWHTLKKSIIVHVKAFRQITAVYDHLPVSIDKGNLPFNHSASPVQLGVDFPL